MINCIDLDDEDDCVMTEEPTIPDKPKECQNIDKKLLTHVRKHRLLYDNKHKMFSNVAKRELVWQQIAYNLKVDVDTCKTSWIELRYNYQCHARRLRKYFNTGHKSNRKRPAMYLESELMFLWRFIQNPKTCSPPFDNEETSSKEQPQEQPQEQLLNQPQEQPLNQPQEQPQEQPHEHPQKQPQQNEVVAEAVNVENVQFGIEDLTNQVIDDDLILVEQPVECIVIDEDDDSAKTEKQFKVSRGMKALVREIQNYPELYDSEHTLFKDYTVKSSIWNTIAGSIGDKATKLMKSWVIMQTRYEWEINQAPIDYATAIKSDLENTLEFMKIFILKNPDTVYKQSFYLRSGWQEPIDYFKDIHNLIVRMKKMADIVSITDLLLNKPEKTKQYELMWEELAKQKGSTAGQCETTWLIMRHFYWELMNMRSTNYQLTDKWYFETIITELYAISKKSDFAKQIQEQQQAQQKMLQKQIKESQKLQTSVSPTIVSNKSNSNNIKGNVRAVLVNQPPAQPQAQQQYPSPLPKITGAMSLAPQALTGAPLQIRQVSMGPNLSMQPSAATAAAPPPPQAPIQMSLNLPQQTNVTTVRMPSLTCVRNLAPPPPSHPTTNIVNTNYNGQTMIRQITPTLQNITPPRTLINPLPTLIRPLAPISTMPTASSISPPQMVPMIYPQVTSPTVVNMAAIETKSLINTTVPIGTTKIVTPFTAQTQLGTRKANNPTPPLPAVITTINCSSTVNPTLPKISGAVSLLNPNEILIELIASQSGNHLVVHGPPLSEKYQLSMPSVAKFIREVLAIPLLHNKRHNQPVLINSYWEHISKKFSLPPHICRACWNFLAENFNHFPQIAPLKDLMAPFKTSLNVWKDSLSLFKVFDEHCKSMGWLPHIKRMPEVVECIGNYPVLFKDVGKESTTETTSDMETLCAWRTIRLRFPNIYDIQDIWKAVKNCFCQYMADLEFGIDNKWPINWWRALARLKFLVEAKYATNEPFYYIVSNKMVEEIERCAVLEMKSRAQKAHEEDSDMPQPMPKIEKDNEDIKQKYIKMQEQQPTTSSASQPGDLLIERPTRRLDIETVALLTAIQKHKAIYGKADVLVKYEAWKEVAKELQMEVPECLMAFRLATQRYLSYKKQDPLSRCRLNQRYFKKLEEIFRSVTKASSSKKNRSIVKNPYEINQDFEILIDRSSPPPSSSTDLIFPERYISDISMSNCDIDLVVKNWNFAIGNLQTGEVFLSKLRSIISKYTTN